MRTQEADCSIPVEHKMDDWLHLSSFDRRTLEIWTGGSDAWQLRATGRFPFCQTPL